MITTAELRKLPLSQVHERLAKVERAELQALVASMLLVEPALRPREIAALTPRPRDVVMRAIRAGEMGDYFEFGENSLAVPASAVNAWRDRSRVRKSKREASAS